MDETLALEDATRLAQQIQAMSNLGMVVFLTTLTVLVLGGMFLLFWKFSSRVQAGDDKQLSGMLEVLVKIERGISQERTVYWRKNSREHKQMIKGIAQLIQGLKQQFKVSNRIVVLLEEIYNSQIDIESGSNEKSNRSNPVNPPNVYRPPRTRTGRSNPFTGND